MNLLITGASGFIGSYFLKKYTEKYNIKSFSFLRDEFSSVDMQSIDTIIHLSALVHQIGGATKEEYKRVNVTQTLQLAQKAKESGVKQFFFMSTVKVYGEESTSCYTEQSECLALDLYGKSKLQAEKELKALENKEFIITIVRTPIVYGYGVKANINNLINLVKKVPILPFADIQNRRSMVYIGNLLYLVDRLVEKQQSGVYLASDDKTLSTADLILLIAKELDKKLYLIKVPFFAKLLQKLKPSFYKRLYMSLALDNEKTKKELQLQNPYTAEEGIRNMLHGENI